MQTTSAGKSKTQYISGGIHKRVAYVIEFDTALQTSVYSEAKSKRSYRFNGFNFNTGGAHRSGGSFWSGVSVRERGDLKYNKSYARTQTAQMQKKPKCGLQSAL